MRLAMVMALTGLAVLPLTTNAQAQESEEAPKQAVEQEPVPSSEPTQWERVPSVRRWHPEAFVDPSEPASEPAPEEPSLQLKLDDAGVEVTPTPEGFYIVEPTELRAGLTRRAKIGIGVGVGLAVALGIATGVAVSQMRQGFEL